MDHSYLFKLLNIPMMVLLSSTMLKSSLIQICIYLSTIYPSYCPNLFLQNALKGIYKRKIKHPVLQDGTCIIFIIEPKEKLKCTNCSTYVNEDFPFFQHYSNPSDITPLLVLEGYERP